MSLLVYKSLLVIYFNFRSCFFLIDELLLEVINLYFQITDITKI